MQHHAIDGESVWHDGNIALAHQAFWTTPEAVGERQPLHSMDGRYQVVFDGRIDNRGELIAELGDIRQSPQSISDAQLVVYGIERWGNKLPEKLLGPFTLLVFDRLTQRLLAARDALGDRTLYYYVCKDFAAIASEPAALLFHPEIDAAVDETQLALLYAIRPLQAGQTLFTAVKELLPAQILTVDLDNVDLRIYWELQPSERLVLKDDQAYAEQFLACLQEAVACRLRTNGKHGAMLSGGLDSTTVAAVAAQQLANQGQRLKSFSWIFDELHECDERAYIQAVVDQSDMDATYVVGDDAWPFNYMESLPISLNAPLGNMYQVLKNRIYAQASEQGIRTLLVGINADQFYLPSQDWLSDLVKDGKYSQASRAAITELQRYRSGFAKSPGVRRLIRNVWRQIIPSVGYPSRIHRPAPGWLTDHAKKLLAEADALEEPRYFGHEARARSIASIYNASGKAHGSDYSIRQGIEIRDPFRDRRLIEFIVSVPAYQLYDGRRTKTIQRNATQEILPDVVRQNRQRVGTLTGLGDRGLFDAGLPYFQEVASRHDALWRTFIDQRWMDTILNNVQQTSYHGAESVLVWKCVMGERWWTKYQQAFHS